MTQEELYNIVLKNLDAIKDVHSIKDLTIARTILNANIDGLFEMQRTKMAATSETSDKPEFVFKEEFGIVKMMQYLTELRGYPAKYATPMQKVAMQWMINMGYITKERTVLEKGVDIDIKLVERIGKDGTPFTQLRYGETVQRILWEQLPDFKAQVDTENGGEYKSSAEQRRGIYYEDIYSSEFQKTISFNGVFATHVFTEDEVKRLLRGERITFAAVHKDGNPYTCVGKLVRQPGCTSTGRELYKFDGRA